MKPAQASTRLMPPMRKGLAASIIASLLLVLIVYTFGSRLEPRSPSFEAETFSAKMQRLQSDNHLLRPQKPSTKHPKSNRFAQFAVALKTGGETLHERVPMQLLTFLSEVDNIVLIGDTSAKIGERNVVDVYTDLYAKTRKKLGIVEVGAEDEPFKRTIKKEDVNAFKNQGQGKRVISGQDVSTDGWQADAHKNLPGFQVLVETYPDADWYLMIDDDTYVVMDNLAQYLEAKNPNEPHFIGRNNYFKGCDGVTQFHTGPGAGTAEHPYIAQGGSGIIISRGAMKKMTKGLNQCIIKYQNCWAGDIRTALCLRDNGVVVSWGDGFYENPPLDEIRFPDDPCSLPNTFHHVLPSQMQTLYEVERENWNFRGTLTTTMDRIFAAFHSSESFVEKDTNRPDGDIEVHNDVETADKCQNLCTKVQFCLAWTFDEIGGHCRLKNRLGEPKSGLKGYTSGVIGGRYTCKRV